MQTGGDLVEQLLGCHIIVEPGEQADMTGADRAIQGQEGCVERGELAGFQGEITPSRLRLASR